MKKTHIVWIMIGILLCFSASCTKKTMESSQTTQQAAPVAPEPQAPEPSVDTQALATDQAEREKMEALNRFLKEYVYFEFDSAVLRSDARAVLEDKAQWLQNNADVTAVVIEGHCDERGTDAYNMALGARRAETIKQFMTDLGLEVGKFQTVSYGEERPVDGGQNEEAWAKNRRGVFVIN